MAGIVGHHEVVTEQGFAPEDPPAVARARRQVERALKRYRGAAEKVAKLQASGASTERVHAARREMWALHEPLEKARTKLANAERRSRKRGGRNGRRP